MISQSPPWWLRSFSIEANEEKNNQKETNNPSHRLQREMDLGNADSFSKSHPPPRSAMANGSGTWLLGLMALTATAEQHLWIYSHVQNHGAVCEPCSFPSLTGE